MIGDNKLKCQQNLVKSNYFLDFCIWEQKFYDLIIEKIKWPIAILNTS